MILKIKMKCPECNEESEREDVCTNCGLVFQDIIIDYQTPERYMNKYTTDKEYQREFNYILDPDIRYMHSHKKKYYKKNTKVYRYMSAYVDISKYCSNLQLPKLIMYEAMNIYINIRKKDPQFFRRYQKEPSYFAFIKIACKLHGFNLSKKELFSQQKTKYNLKNLFEIYKKRKNKKEIRCPHCSNIFKSEVGLKRHLSALNRKEIEKKFNKAYSKTIELLKIRFNHGN